MYKALPSRRSGTTYEVTIGDRLLILRTGNYPNGMLGEISIEMEQNGNELNALMHQYGRAASIGLQHSVPLSALVDLFVELKFSPCGLVTGDKDLKRVDSCLDYIGNRLTKDYCHRKDFEGRRIFASVNGEIIAHAPTIDGNKLILTSQAYPDGRLGKFKVSVPKEKENPFYMLLGSFADVVSLGLQYGAPLQQYADAFRDTAFSPSGVVWRDPNITQVKSVLDYIFRRIELDYPRQMTLPFADWRTNKQHMTGHHTENPLRTGTTDATVIQLPLGRKKTPG